MSYMNLAYGPTRNESFVAQWLERLTSVQKVIGSIPVKDPDFFFVLCLWHVDHITSHFFSHSSIFTYHINFYFNIFIIHFAP